MARKRNTPALDGVTEVVVRYGLGFATSVTTRHGRIEKVTTWVPGIPNSTKRTESVPKRLK